MSPAQRSDFFDVQRRQWRISLLYTVLLFTAYFLVFGLMVFLILFVLDLALADMFRISWTLAARVFLWTAVAALLVAAVQYISARRSGAAFILRRLGAASPDPNDLYHARYLNVVEEMRISAGLPRTKAYLLPFLAVNSLALLEADGTPAVVVTEGLLAECTREELQASVAHELAHILRGDVFYITLLCSLADFFERLAQALTPEKDTPQLLSGVQAGGVAAQIAARGVGSLGASLSGAVLRVLSLLVSRERELLADAAAVELCRDPVSLARVLYRAGLKNSFVGDFSLTYAPLLMVSSDPASEEEGWGASLFHTHPPLARRIKILADMAAKSPDEIVDQVWESRKTREQARRLKMSSEEYERLRPNRTPEETPAPPADDERLWRLKEAGRQWTHPLTVEELVSHPKFSPMILVRNEGDGVEARAREFLSVRQASRRLGRRQLSPESPDRPVQCPRCRKPLADDYYEGVAVKVCRSCRGILVPMSGMERVLARKEYAFSEELVRKALEFKKNVLRNPLVADRKAGRRASGALLCPRCGSRMIAHPFNYQFFIPVDKCLACHRIWFEADELEMLQVLVEKG